VFLLGWDEKSSGHLFLLCWVVYCNSSCRSIQLVGLAPVVVAGGSQAQHAHQPSAHPVLNLRVTLSTLCIYLSVRERWFTSLRIFSKTRIFRWFSLQYLYEYTINLAGRQLLIYRRAMGRGEGGGRFLCVELSVALSKPSTVFVDVVNSKILSSLSLYCNVGYCR
jgi:hypothetical protein